MRATFVALALLFSPAPALACGMYIPPEQDKVILADVLDEIDGVTEAVKDSAKAAVVDLLPSEATPVSPQADAANVKAEADGATKPDA